MGKVSFMVEKQSTPGHGKQDLSDWTTYPDDLTDIEVASGSITLNGIDRDQDVLFYKEYPDWIGTFEINVDVKLNVGSIAGGMFNYFGVTDFATSNYANAGKGVHNIIQRSSAGGTRQLRMYNRTSIDTKDQTIVDDTWYYMKIGRKRVNWFYEIYSDPERTVLVASKDISETGIRIPYRGWFMSTDFDGGSGDPIYCEVANMVWVNRQVFTEGWNPNNSYINDAADETGDYKYVDFQSSSGSRMDIARYIDTGSRGAVVKGAYIANYHLDTRKKFYAEATFVQQGSALISESRIGISSGKFGYTSNADHHLGAGTSWCVQQNGYARNGTPGSNIADYTPTFSDGDICMMAIDLTNLTTDGAKIWFGRNGVWGTAPGGVGDPANGTNASVDNIDDSDGINFFPSASLAGENNRIMIKADPARWTYTPPSGFGAFRCMADDDSQ